MHDLLTWYFAVALLGIAALPVTWRALGNLPDRGWALSKPLAILLIGFLCWWPPVVFHALPYSRGWIILVALAFVAANVALVVRRPALGQEILSFVRQRWLYVAINEALFAGVMWLMGYLRALSPAANEGTEKFMDQAFLSAIMRAQHLPPPDPWLAGYPINYYYFGHFLIATLAKLLGTAPAVAFNCGIALTAALVASAIFGVAANLTATMRNVRQTQPDAAAHLTGAIPYALFAVVATLVMGNLRSFGIWWNSLGQSGIVPHAPTAADAWQWLTHPATWAVTYWGVWWPSSRAIPNTITEFPDFSFLLADLHAHVLALPYAVLAIGVALNIWLAPARPGLRLFGSRWQAVAMIGVAGLSIGALYLLNGWDLPTYLALALVAIVLHQWNAHGRSFTAEFAKGLGLAGGALILVCVIPYLPFYLTFSSPGQGVGLVLGTANHLAVPFSASAAVQAAHPESRTALIDELGVNGVMLAIFGSWLVVLMAQRLTGLIQARQHTRWKASLPRLQPAPVHAHLAALTTTDSGTLVAHHTISTSIAVEAGQSWLRAWGIIALTSAALVWLTWRTAAWEGWTFVWMLLLAGAALWLALEPLYQVRELTPQVRAMTFPLVMIAFGAGLIAMCEIVFLRDVFVGNLPRMNTVFKAYFQVWTIFALASAPALAWLVGHLRDKLPVRQAATWQPVAYLWRGIWAIAILALIAATLIFPLGTSHTLYPLDQKHPALTLDALHQNPYVTPADVSAIMWLNAHVQGSPVIAEANDKSEYNTTNGRISVFTGLPTIIGWNVYGHEYQWRVNWLTNPAYAADYSGRLGDLHTIYTSSDHALVLQTLRRYHVRYVIVGAFEWQTYGTSNTLGTFAQFLRPVYQTDGVVIYGVPNA